MRGTLEQRLWAKIDRRGPDECWLWTAAVNTSGYGCIGVLEDGRWRIRPAHRIVWQLEHGEIPERLHVLHRCDQPRCCNPRHLWLGTQADNVRDCATKGRLRPGNPRGEQHGSARLTTEAVLAIRARHERGERHTSIAADHGIDRRHVGRIVRRERWAHVA